MRQDIRLAVRAIGRAPMYAVMVIGSLAIGIATPALAFTMLNAAFLRPVDGVRDAGSLVAATLLNERGGAFSTYDDYAALRDGLDDLVLLAARTLASVAVSREGGDALSLGGEIVSANYFDIIGLRPAAGQFFSGTSDQPMRELVAVIGHTTWRRHFQSDPAVIGSALIVNGLPLQIVGVAPERFHGFHPENEVEIWLPLGVAELVFRRNGRPVSAADAGPRNYNYVGRLRAGVTAAQVQARGSAITARDRGEGWRFVLGPLSRIVRTSYVNFAMVMASIMALPLLVLAIACVNAGNLVLARATQASTIWGVQLALGASRARVLRQPLIEGLLLALPAAAAGLLVIGWAFPALQGLVPLDLVIDWRVTLFALTIAMTTPLVFGLVPASSVLARTARRLPGQTLQVSARSRARGVLIAGQVGLSLALLGTGIQFVRTVGGGFGDGFGPGDALLVATFDTDKPRLPQDAADAFYTTLLDGVRTIPGAGHAALGGGLNFVALVPREGQAALWLPDDPPGQPRSTLIAYTAGDLFRTLGLSLIGGRAFRPEEHRSAPKTVIVNDPFARRVLGGNALGRTIRLGTTTDHAEAVDAVVVGVVTGAQDAPGRNDTLPTVFAPAPLAYLPVRTLYVPFRDAPSLAAAIPLVRATARSADWRVPYRLGTMDDARAERAAPSRFTALSVTILGVVALVLAAAGIYAAIAYAVELRRREIGVRVALGATAASILGLVVGDMVRTTVLGAVLGTAAAAAAAIVVRSRLYGAATIDPAVFAGATGVLMVTMLIASAIPARRATRVDPLPALRSE